MSFARFLAAACMGLLLNPTSTPAGQPPTALPVAPPPAEPGKRGLRPLSLSATQAYGKKLAVIVGINYEGSLQLRNAESDAQKFRDLLVKCFDYKEDEVRLLLGKAATKQAMEGALHNGFLCGKDVTAEDSVLFYYSGHGESRPRANGSREGYLYPADIAYVVDKTGKATSEINYGGSAIKITEVVKNLRDDCKAKHKLLILDCCHAGSIFRVDGGAKADGTTFDRPDPGLLATPAFQAMTASREWQTASDGERGAGNSPFTASLIHAMCTLGKKQALGAGSSFRLTELFATMKDNLNAELRGRQNPECNWIGEDRGEFHFFPAPNAPFPSGVLTEKEQQMLLAMVPSTFGNWWADEIPWYMPSLRQDIWEEASKSRSSSAGTDANTILKAARELAKQKAASDYRYKHLDLLLNAKDVTTRDAAMRTVVKHLKEETAKPDPRPADLHYLGVLQHKLKDFDAAHDAYIKAIEKYEEGRVGNDKLTPLYALCLLDHGILCLNTRKEYQAAIDKFRKAREVVATKNSTPPIPFLVFAKCREADANRRLGQFGVSGRLMDEARSQITDYDLRSVLPMSAAVWKHNAWAMMEECRFKEAAHSFRECEKILKGLFDRGVNRLECQIDLFHVRHGMAMIERFQGNDIGAVREFRLLTTEIATEMRQLTLAHEPPVNHAELRQLLAERYQNSLDRQADCHLFGRYPDYAEAADDYRLALRVVAYIPPERQDEVRIDLMYRRAVALCLAPSESRDTEAAKKLCDEADKLERSPMPGKDAGVPDAMTAPRKPLSDKTRIVRAIAQALVKNAANKDIPSALEDPSRCKAGHELWAAIRVYRPASSTTGAGQVGRVMDRDEAERVMFAYRLLILDRKRWGLDRLEVADCCEELLSHCRAATRSGRARREVDLQFLVTLRDYYDAAFAAKAERQPGGAVPVKELIEIAWSATKGESYTKPPEVAPVVVLYRCSDRDRDFSQFYLLVDVPGGSGQTPFSHCLPLKAEWNDLAMLKHASDANRPLPLPADVHAILTKIKAESVIVRWHDPVSGLGPLAARPKPRPGETVAGSSPVASIPDVPSFPFRLDTVFGGRVLPEIDQSRGEPRETNRLVPVSPIPQKPVP